MRRYSEVEPLTADHQRAHFACTSSAITDWFRQHAHKAQQSDTCRVYVLRRLEDDLVVGFYGLSSGAIRRPDSPVRLIRGTGLYPTIPVVQLSRLAVDVGETGRGLGRALVMDAFRRVVHAASEVGIRALQIHAEDQRAADFYLKLARFERSPTDDRHLLLLMKDLRRAVALDD